MPSNANSAIDPSLQAVVPNLDPGPSYATDARKYQGIPGIERTPGGRLWATWYSGGTGEGPQNFVVVVNSDDNGHSWSPPVVVIDPPGQVRAFDPCPWVDPSGALWLFWSQSEGLWDGRAGVWAMTCTNPDAAAPTWSAPRRVANGIMMCKPTALRDGRWLMPAAIWLRPPIREDMLGERYPNVYVSGDQGANWSLLGHADLPGRNCDEHMIVERNDGSIWMLVRMPYGIGQSISHDGGRTWSPGGDTGFGGPDSRFFIRRLQSGRLLLVNHYKHTQRSHMTALLSEDDGRTWPHHLLLDERSKISYPDGTQGEGGQIYVIYDRERYTTGDILMATFTEADILAGKCVSDHARLKGRVNHLR